MAPSCSDQSLNSNLFENAKKFRDEAGGVQAVTSWPGGGGGGGVVGEVVGGVGGVVLVLVVINGPHWH
jgi:hypothetical protein